MANDGNVKMMLEQKHQKYAKQKERKKKKKGQQTRS